MQQTSVMALMSQVGKRFDKEQAVKRSRGEAASYRGAMIARGEYLTLWGAVISVFDPSVSVGASTLPTTLERRWAHSMARWLYHRHAALCAHKCDWLSGIVPLWN